MAKRKRLRPTYYPDLGPFFVALRKRRRWSQNAVERFARAQGLWLVTRQKVLRLERGGVKNPDPEVLRELAILYQVPFADIYARLERVRSGIEMTAPHADTHRESGSSLSSIRREIDAQDRHSARGIPEPGIEVITAHVERLIKIAYAHPKLGQQLRHAAESLITRYLAAVSAPSTGHAANGRAHRESVRRLHRSGSTGQ